MLLHSRNRCFKTWTKRISMSKCTGILSSPGFLLLKGMFLYIYISMVVLYFLIIDSIIFQTLEQIFERSLLQNLIVGGYCWLPNPNMPKSPRHLKLLRLLRAYKTVKNAQTLPLFYFAWWGKFCQWSWNNCPRNWVLTRVFTGLRPFMKWIQLLSYVGWLETPSWNS